jgi:type II secretory pathway predicted ATPase ExeA
MSTKVQTAMQFFGLPYPPFADTFEVQEPFLCDSESLIVQRIVTLLRQGRSCALFGEAGSGKSMLIKAIAQQFDSKEYRIAHVPYGGLKPGAIIRDLCDEFDIDTTGRKNLLSRIALDFKRDNQKPFPVIVIDEAHEMEKQSFFDLCALLHEAKTRTASAAMVLVGQPVLKKILELDIYMPVRTRLTCMFSMPKLSIDEAQNFIRYRLNIAHVKEPLFEEDALKCLAVDTKGNKRVLMNMAALSLEEAARRNEKVIASEIVTTIAQEFL